MPTPVPSKVIAAIFALSAFTIAIIAGLAAGNPGDEILIRALVSLVVCFALGGILGAMAESAVHEHIRQHALRNPLPHSGAAGANAQSAQSSGGGKTS